MLSNNPEFRELLLLHGRDRRLGKLEEELNLLPGDIIRIEQKISIENESIELAVSEWKLLETNNTTLEKEIIEIEIEKEAQESLIAEKDFRIRDLEMKATKADKRVEHLEPELEKMEEKYSREKDRLGKIFNIATELDDDLKLAVTEMKARDDWYVSHMTLFEDLNKAIKERYEMIERAVESERKSQHMARAIEDRVEEMVTARAAEMTIDEAEESVSGAKSEETETPAEDEPVVEESENESEAAPEEPTTESTEPAAQPAATPATTTWADDEDPWADN